MAVIRSSDIGNYLYCRRAWWYRKQGIESDNRAELAAGTRAPSKAWTPGAGLHLDSHSGIDPAAGCPCSADRLLHSADFMKERIYACFGSTVSSMGRRDEVPNQELAHDLAPEEMRQGSVKLPKTCGTRIRKSRPIASRFFMKLDPWSPN